jgi:phage gp45-like
MIKTIRNFFKVARLLATMDNNDLRIANVQTMGKSQKVMLFTPYGLMHNPPANSMALVWSQQGQESNGIGMADDPANRTLKGLEPGEVAIGNYETGAYILFSADGSCKIKADNIDFDCTGTLTATANTSLSLISPIMTNNGINVGSTHVHSQGADSDGDAEQDTEVPH